MTSAVRPRRSYVGMGLDLGAEPDRPGLPSPQGPGPGATAAPAASLAWLQRARRACRPGAAGVGGAPALCARPRWSARSERLGAGWGVRGGVRSRRGGHARTERPRGRRRCRSRRDSRDSGRAAGRCCAPATLRRPRWYIPAGSSGCRGVLGSLSSRRSLASQEPAEADCHRQVAGSRQPQPQLRARAADRRVPGPEGVRSRSRFPEAMPAPTNRAARPASPPRRGRRRR